MLLSEHNLRNFTNEEVLMLAIKEYANPSNYESYEKDYGEGAVAERMPYIAREPRQFANDVLAFIAARMVKKVDTTDLKSVSASCSGSSPDASTKNISMLRIVEQHPHRTLEAYDKNKDRWFTVGNTEERFGLHVHKPSILNG